MGKKPRPTKSDYDKALELLSDEDVKAGLARRRAMLISELANLNADLLFMEGLPEAQGKKHKAQVLLVKAQVDDIDARLAGAAKLLRAFSKQPTESAD